MRCGIRRSECEKRSHDGVFGWPGEAMWSTVPMAIEQREGKVFWDFSICDLGCLYEADFVESYE